MCQFSMPCCEVFDCQSAEYKEQVLPAAVRNRVAVEAGSTTISTSTLVSMARS